MCSNELLSIIVPVYNVEQYLPRCIDSILFQTYSNLELILIDDGSIDDSARICDDYQKNDPRVQVLHKKNRGVSSARNVGLDLARGAFIGWVDSDDWIEPDMYSTLINLIIKHKVDVAECKYIVERDEGQLTSPKTVQKIESGKNFFMLDLYLIRGVFGGVATKLYRRNAFNDFRFPLGRIFEDRTMVLYGCVNNFSFVSTPEVKYHYCYREKSITTFSISEQYARQYIYMIQRFLVLANTISDNKRKNTTVKQVYEEALAWYIKIGRELKKPVCRIYLTLFVKSTGLNLIETLKSADTPFKIKITLLMLHLGLIKTYRFFYKVISIMRYSKL